MARISDAPTPELAAFLPRLDVDVFVFMSLIDTPRHRVVMNLSHHPCTLLQAPTKELVHVSHLSRNSRLLAGGLLAQSDARDPWILSTSHALPAD